MAIVRGILTCLLSLSILAFGYTPIQHQAFVTSYALGNAVTAMPGLSDASLKNPSLSKTVDAPHLNAAYSTSERGLSTYGFSWIIPQDRMAFSFHIPIRQLENLDRTIEGNNGRGQVFGQFSDHQTDFSVGASTSFFKESFFLGAGLNYHAHTIENENASGLTAKLGAFYNVYEKLYLGASIDTIQISALEWSTGRKESFNRSYNLGLGVRLLKHATLLADLNRYEGYTSTHLGLMADLHPSLSLLGGVYDIQKQKRLSIGLNLHLDELTINYAYSPSENTGNFHKFGVRYDY